MATDDGFHHDPPPGVANFMSLVDVQATRLSAGFPQALFIGADDYLTKMLAAAIAKDDGDTVQDVLDTVFTDSDEGMKIFVEVQCSDVWVYVIFSDTIGAFTEPQRAEFTDGLFIWLAYIMRFVPRHGSAHICSVTRFRERDEAEDSHGRRLSDQPEDLYDVANRYCLRRES